MCFYKKSHTKTYANKHIFLINQTIDNPPLLNILRKDSMMNQNAW